MQATLQTLIELQKVDKELQRLEELKGDLPQRVEFLRREMNGLVESRSQKVSEQDEVRKLKMHLEGDLQTLQATHTKLQEQLYSVKNNREYDAITVEIDTVTEKIDLTETEILDLIGREEALTEEIRGLDEQIETLKESLVVSEKELEEKTRATETETNSYLARRDALTAKISRPTLYQYDRIRNALGNPAVVPIERYACTGCYSSIPPQKAVNVRAMDQLILCESCGRILVAEPAREVVS